MSNSEPNEKYFSNIATAPGFFRKLESWVVGDGITVKEQFHGIKQQVSVSEVEFNSIARMLGYEKREPK